MGDSHPRLHLLVGERLEAGHVLKAAGRTEHLDPVGAGADLGARDAHHILGAVGSPTRRGARARRAAGDAQAVAGHEHARPDHQAAIDQRAHRDIRIVLRAEIANRGHTRLQSLAGILLGEIDGNGGRPCGLTEGTRVRAIPDVGHVRVEIDQPGNDRKATEVDHARPLRNGGLRITDGRDPGSVDNDDRGRRHFSSTIDEFPDFENRRLGAGDPSWQRHENDQNDDLAQFLHRILIRLQIVIEMACFVNKLQFVA